MKDKDTKEAASTKAYWRGRRARRLDLKQSDNPHLIDAALSLAWLRGWQSMNAELRIKK